MSFRRDCSSTTARWNLGVAWEWGYRSHVWLRENHLFFPFFPELHHGWRSSKDSLGPHVEYPQSGGRLEVWPLQHSNRTIQVHTVSTLPCQHRSPTLGIICYQPFRLVPDTMPLQYLPILYADRLRVMKKHLKVRKLYFVRRCTITLLLCFLYTGQE